MLLSNSTTRQAKIKSAKSSICHKSSTALFGINSMAGQAWKIYFLFMRMFVNSLFFQEIDEAYGSGEKQYAFYNTTMDYIYKAVKAFHFRKGKAKSKEYEPISRIFGNRTTSDNATDYRHRDKIIEICDEYKARLGRLYMALRSADEKEREVIYERIQDEKAERDSKVSRWLTSINVMLFVIRHYEKNSPSDWRIYAPLINTPLFQKEMLAYPVPEFFIVEDPDGMFWH